MNSETVLSHSPKRLTQTQREAYFEQGYLVMSNLFNEAQLSAFRSSVNKLTELSRELTESNTQFDLEVGHSLASPKLRRVAFADDVDASLWELCANSLITDIATDILGPNVRFRDVFVNFKWAGGGAAVKWHQDIAFYPHTNLGTCQFLLALEDVTSAQGPLQVIPESHKGPIFEHYDSEDEWSGSISEDNLSIAGIDGAVELTGPAGTLSVHHSNTIHGSARNESDRGRPMIVITYSAADAIPYTTAPYPSSHYGALVRGEQPRIAHHEALEMPLPPDWSGGYTSIFTHQHDKEA
ncbi:MAG: ectoine hydroxylase-related dioxygenase (phytanoyl-CoA dioxygenase family) [Saprospiraceae bacterium]|jgi:ectoine hydroxylase-related dioxygenase (phytanoyl-CoA dioxygenase family)